MPTADQKLNKFSERINHKTDVSCNSSFKDNNLHCHIVSKNDVSLAVTKLKSDTSDVLLKRNVCPRIIKLLLYMYVK